MIKLSHLLLLVAIAAASAAAAAATKPSGDSPEGAPPKRTETEQNLRSLKSSHDEANGNVFLAARRTNESDGDGADGDDDGEESTIEEYVFDPSDGGGGNNLDTTDNTVGDSAGNGAGDDSNGDGANENSAAGDDAGANANSDSRRRNRNPTKKTVVYNTYTALKTLEMRTDVTVLFESFHTKTTAEYGFALLFTAILAFSLETLIACRRDDWVGLNVNSNTSNTDHQANKSYLCSAIILTMLHVLTLTIGIMLILIIVGSFNVGIIVAAILGSGTGRLVYTARRFKSDAKRAMKRRQSRSTAGESGDEHDVEKGNKSSGRASFLNTTALTNLTTIPEDGFTDNDHNDDDRTAASSTIESRSTRRHHRVHSTRGGSRSSSRGSSQYGRASQRASQRLGHGGSSNSSRIPTTISLTSDDNEQDNRKRQRRAAVPAPQVPVATAIQEHQSNTDLETPVPLVRSVSPIVSDDMSDVIVYADDEDTVRSEF